VGVPDSSRPRPEPRTDTTSNAQPCLGRIVASDPDGVRVVFAGQAEPTLARVLGPVPPEQLEAALRDARPILLGFLEGRVTAPVIMSLASMADLPQPELPEETVEVEVDGTAIEREVIEAKDELVLRCGAASITLRADGTVRVTGRDITSWARRRHRIRGGSVAIN
jgi:hypothetical protein